MDVSLELRNKVHFTRQHYSKLKNVTILVIIYLAVVLLIVFVFAKKSQIIDNYGNPLSDQADKFYYSGVVYFTIGFGDFLPYSSTDKIYVLVEGFLGVLINGIFLGFLVFFLQSAQSKVQFTKNLFIYKDDNNQFIAAICIKNRGHLIADINRGIDILRKLENKSTNRLASAYQHRNYLNNKAKFEINENECGKIFSTIQTSLKGPTQNLIIRMFLSGHDSTRRSSIIAFEECELKVAFVKDITIVPKYWLCTRKMKDAGVRLSRLTSDEVKEIRREFQARTFTEEKDCKCPFE